MNIGYYIKISDGQYLYFIDREKDEVGYTPHQSDGAFWGRGEDAQGCLYYLQAQRALPHKGPHYVSPEVCMA